MGGALTETEEPRAEQVQRAVLARGGSRRWAYDLVVVVLAVGLLVTAGLSVVTALLTSSNENHLLALRSKEVASTLTTALPDIETPLAAGVALADISNADVAKFNRLADTYVGTGHEFVSMSVWRLGHLDAGPVDVIGARPELSSSRGGAVPALKAAAGRSDLTVRNLLHAAQPRIAYAYAGSGKGPYIVEAEQALPANRYVHLGANSAYSNLNVAAYMAKRPVRSQLLLSTVPHLPLPGTHATAVVPFGSETLTVVISARQPLGGEFPQLMPWGVGIVGLLLTLGAAALTYRLITGRREAQALALENRRLYAEQRGIAQSLQHALLPEELPGIDGAVLAARYEAGAPGVDIGGDWYDMISLGGDRLLLVVGDVTGRGIRAATAMAALRFAIQYAARTEPPEVFLPKLSALRPLRETKQLATVLCATLDLGQREARLVSAGHLPPVLVHGGEAELLWAEVGVPVGVDANAVYTARTFPLPDQAMLLGYTDGLVERRGESLDDGLERLRRVAAEAGDQIEDLMTQILKRVKGPDSVDDTAIAGIQWMKKPRQKHE